ncbi:MAG: hypothetical protein AAB509_01875 [Patescibacteria group bacterium]
MLFEVHADVVDPVWYGSLRTQLAGDSAIRAKRPNNDPLATDKIFAEYHNQALFHTGGMG